MKSKIKFKSGAFTTEINNKLMTIPEIDTEIEVEFELQEIKGLYEIEKQLLKDLPGLLKDFIKETESLSQELQTTIQ